MNARPCVRNRRQEPTRVYKDCTMKYTSGVCLQNDWPVFATVTYLYFYKPYPVPNFSKTLILIKLIKNNSKSEI